MRAWTSAFCCWVVSTHECAVVGCRRGATDPDHIKHKGLGGRKKQHRPFIEPIDEKNVLPLCRYHHTMRHAAGVDTFYHTGLHAFRWTVHDIYEEWLAMHSDDWERWHRIAYPHDELAE